MLYIIEAFGFIGMFYYLTKKYLTIKESILCACIIFISGFLGDPYLYRIGFIWTAYNLLTNLIVNGIPLIGSIIGVGISAKKN